MAETPETPRPLPTDGRRWRCGGTRAPQETRAELCVACLALLDEIARCYQGAGPAADEPPAEGDADG